jgi:hypothetical protein
MLNVLVNTQGMGKRKAWFIAAVDSVYALVVFKNNDPEKNFQRVLISSISLDTISRVETEPVKANTLREVNQTLKNKSV